MVPKLNSNFHHPESSESTPVIPTPESEMMILKTDNTGGELTNSGFSKYSQKVKKMFETPTWDRKHMPPNCDYKLFTASSPIMRFCIMQYLR